MMKKIFLVLLLFGVLVIGVNATAAEKSFVYKSITKDVVVPYTEKVTAEKNQIIDEMSSDNGVVTLTVLNPDFTTKKWENTDKKQGNKLTAERNGNIIKLQGIFKGRIVSKELKIDSRPWFQTWSLSLGSFALSGKESQEFWNIRDSDLKEYAMVVLREKEETINVNGQDTEAVKLKVTLIGWLSRFWSANYWFRQSDGVFLRYEGANGGPGTPKTIVELVKE